MLCIRQISPHVSVFCKWFSYFLAICKSVWWSSDDKWRKLYCNKNTSLLLYIILSLYLALMMRVVMFESWRYYRLRPVMQRKFLTLFLIAFIILVRLTQLTLAEHPWQYNLLNYEFEVKYCNIITQLANYCVSPHYKYKPFRFMHIIPMQPSSVYANFSFFRTIFGVWSLVGIQMPENRTFQERIPVFGRLEFTGSLEPSWIHRELFFELACLFLLITLYDLQVCL